MLQPAKCLAGVNVAIQTSIASAERVFSILDLPQEKNEKDMVYKRRNFEEYKRLEEMRQEYATASAARTQAKGNR